MHLHWCKGSEPGCCNVPLLLFLRPAVPEAPDVVVLVPRWQHAASSLDPGQPAGSSSVGSADTRARIERRSVWAVVLTYQVENVQLVSHLMKAASAWEPD